MDQRPLRAGDSVDDYCPRERRVTSHAIVAIVDDVIRQTRCSTCDSEHDYKDGKAPRPRKKGPALVVPGGAPISNGHGAIAAAPVEAASMPDPVPAAAVEAVQAVASETPAHAAGNGNGHSAAEDLWTGHRPLIRATLPRTEGDQPATARPIPEFTMHQRHGRGGHGFRQGQWQDRNGNGPAGFRAGNGDGQGRGQQQPGPGGGRNRHRHRSKSRRSR